MNYKIINGKLLVSSETGISLKEADLYIRDNRMSFVPFGVDETFEVVDAKRRLVMPGLINMHTHAYMTIMRNYADDVPFVEWLFNRVNPVEDRLPKEAAYWTSLLAFSEMIMTGTTGFVDMHMYHRMSASAAKDAGMRGFIGRGLVGSDLYGDGYSRFKEAIEEKEEFECETLKFILSPHAIYTCSLGMLKQIVEESEKRGMMRQTHLSEGMTEIENCLKQYGRTPVEVMNDIGFLSPKTILAHCVQMQGNDLDLIKASGSTIVTNPASNAKLGNGFAPVLDMQKKGINLCIGTDGPASNNTLNMFREMGLLSLIHKGIHCDPTTLASEYIIDAATKNAGYALGQGGELGVIAEGAKADLIFIDLDAPNLFPNNNIISSLCYSAYGTEVDSVMINGKFVRRNNELLTIDLERVYFEVQKVVDQYL